MDSKNVNDDNEAIAADIQENKVIGILAYFLFFIPLLTSKDSKFAMYHANQGLLLFLLVLAVNTVGTILPLIGWLLILPIGNLLILCLLIMGIINSSKGEMKPLPVLGKYTIITPPDKN
ncbi:hypothetical protein GLW08_16690 [Pontibacillus yanchengensis]|uniref:DUF4870 domain-containing protein n=2 Tax=Pontibacillus yanchengensis TaxID=462910 RepID=A0A6I5A310_9BACI|nr:hypothetical protein [Pontibacillus yanchengensis]MYL32579.1 hypothetical protein [Pontibacillus yanchengensis]MYL54973.1 hypothetical protein [Pontibacillus yanchengensis]